MAGAPEPRVIGRLQKALLLGTGARAGFSPSVSRFRILGISISGSLKVRREYLCLRCPHAPPPAPPFCAASLSGSPGVKGLGSSLSRSHPRVLSNPSVHLSLVASFPSFSQYCFKIAVTANSRRCASGCRQELAAAQRGRTAPGQFHQTKISSRVPLAGLGLPGGPGHVWRGSLSAHSKPSWFPT